MSELRNAGVPFLFVDLDTGQLWAQRKVDGKKKKRPLGFDLKDKAAAVKCEAFRDFVGQETGTFEVNSKVTCDQMFEEVMRRFRDPLSPTVTASTDSGYRSRWKHHVSRELKRMQVGDVRSHHIVRELRLMKKGGAKENSVRGLYVMLGSVFGAATRDHVDADGKVTARFRSDNPVRQLDKKDVPPIPEPTQTPTDVIHDYEDVKRMAEALPDTRASFVLKHVFLLLPLLGLRIGEMLALQISDYHPSPFGGGHGEIHVLRQLNPKRKSSDGSTWFAPAKGRTTMEGNQARVVPVLTVEAKRLLDAYVEKGLTEGWLIQGGLLFPSTKQTPIFQSNSYRRMQAAIEKAGTGHMTHHHFRHVFATDVRREGGEWGDVARVLGHKDGGVLAKARYAHITDQEQREFNERLVKNAEARSGRR